MMHDDSITHQPTRQLPEKLHQSMSGFGMILTKPDEEQPQVELKRSDASDIFDPRG
jgi:hypothetical protein